LFLAYTLLILVFVAQWAYTQKKENREKLERFEEVFRGCKDTNLGRAWPLFWLGRIFIFVFVVCLFNDSARFFTLTIVLLVQILYTIAVALLKPFQEWVDYYVELVNGVMLAIQLIFLYFQDKGSRWNNGIDDFYISLIVITVFANTLLIIGEYL